MSLALTRMQNFRAQSDLDKFEERASITGAFEAFVRQTASATGIVSPELQAQFEASNGNTLEVPVIQKQTTTIGSTRNLTIADNENNSAMQSITSTTYVYDFTIIPSQYTNNEVGRQRDFNAKLARGINQMLKNWDTACATVLDAAKTQQFGDALVYDTTGNVLHSTLTQGEYLIGDLDPVMMSNDFEEVMHIIGNAGVMSRFIKTQQKGAANSENNILQWNGKNMYFSNRIANATNKGATGYAIVNDCLGMVHRVERDSRLRHDTGDGKEWNIVNLPGIPFPVGLYSYTTAADKSALHAGTADMTRTKVEAYSISVDLGFFAAYNSDAANLASPVLKFDIDTDDTL